MAENVKKIAKEQRDTLQHGIYRVINPFVRLLIRIGVTPNMVTTVGFLGQVAVAVLICVAAVRAELTGVVEWGWLALSGILIIAFSVFDMLDGQVARLGNMVSTFGAMYDSVLDRYSEILILGATSWFFMASGFEWAAVLAFLALMGSLIVSYVRARGEGLGVSCKMGFMQRPERVVTITLGLLISGIVGEIGGPSPTNDMNAPMVILTVAVGIVAVFSNMTAIARLLWCKRALGEKDRENQK